MNGMIRKNERKDTIMDDLEKVERLRERADVSYEEAKKALDECEHKKGEDHTT